MKEDIQGYKKQKDVVIENIRQGLHFKEMKHNKAVYEQGKNLTENNLKAIERMNREFKVGNARMLILLRAVSELGYHISKDFEQATKEDIMSFIESKENSKLATSSINVYRSVIKQFYKWLQGNNKNYPEIVEWIQLEKTKGNGKLPEELLTQQDVKELIRHSRQVRNKAFISILYESGCRIGEILTIKLKHLQFNEMGVKVIVNGKTGMRRILLRDSVPYLKALLNEHQQADNKEAYLFISQRGNRWHYQDVYPMLRLLFKRAKVNKPFNPHIFRHSRCSFLANYLTEQQLKNYCGWVQGSKMASIYVHLSGEQIDNALLSKVYNVKEVKQEAIENKLQPKECPKCKEVNSATTKFCVTCSSPLDYEQQEAVEKVKDFFGNVINELMAKQQVINEDNSKAVMKEKLPEIMPILNSIVKLQKQ